LFPVSEIAIPTCFEPEARRGFTQIQVWGGDPECIPDNFFRRHELEESEVPESPEKSSGRYEFRFVADYSFVVNRLFPFAPNAQQLTYARWLPIRSQQSLEFFNVRLKASSRVCQRVCS
jgi:hypothetical protein